MRGLPAGTPRRRCGRIGLPGGHHLSRRGRQLLAECLCSTGRRLVRSGADLVGLQRSTLGRVPGSLPAGECSRLKRRRHRRPLVWGCRRRSAAHSSRPSPPDRLTDHAAAPAPMCNGPHAGWLTRSSRARLLRPPPSVARPTHRGPCRSPATGPRGGRVLRLRLREREYVAVHSPSRPRWPRDSPAG